MCEPTDIWEQVCAWVHGRAAGSASAFEPTSRLAQQCTPVAYNGIAVGRDVVITAPDQAKYDEFLLDLKALAEEAGFTHIMQE